MPKTADNVKNRLSPAFKKPLVLLVLSVLFLFDQAEGISLDRSRGDESSGDAAMPEMIIEQADRGGRFEINQGSVFSIHLEENPSTGYQWEISEMDRQIFELRDSQYLGASGTVLGAGGLRVLTFVAKAPGETAVRLRLRKAWEPEDKAIGHFEVTLHVIEAE